MIRLALGVLSALAVLTALAWHVAAAQPAPATARAAQYVGPQSCSGCHAAQAKSWQQSHHEQAMQAATPATVLAPFRGETFSDGGIRSSFFRDRGKFMVRTDGPDGHAGNFEITYTLGVYPLQQYLIPMPNGAMQVLGIAWDARPKSEGGQRWFHLHAGEHLHAGDPLHWTGRQNNWNAQCADCHTTGFRKNFTADINSYRSTWPEAGVGCEACHGPGSRHLAWAALSAKEREADRSHGLMQGFDARHVQDWHIDARSGNAVRNTPLLPARKENELCARCHAHRSQIGEQDASGQPLLDTYIPSTLEKALFWNDGQMKAEVFNYASFEQSKMFRKGVTCSDCHDPHSLELRRPGNQTCLQCHAAAKYDAPAHHHHNMDSTGAACASCHMPTTTYMRVDARHDHSTRIPRPDLSLKNGTPNACNRCHANRDAAWAARQAQAWYPDLAQHPTPLADALQAADHGEAQSLPLLSAIIADRERSPIDRASALARLPQPLDAAYWKSVRARLTDSEPLVRLAAVEALAGAPEIERSALRARLSDPVKGVRIATARALADAHTENWTRQDKEALVHATDEYVAAQRYNADRPEAWNNLGLLHAVQGNWKQSEEELKKADAMAPDFVASALNLADVYRAEGRDEEALRLLVESAARHPGDANTFYALGLAQLRLKQVGAALANLKRASQLAPENAQFAAVYKLALAETPAAANR